MPSDDQVRHEVQLTEKLAKLKASYGLDVHKKAVELAKDPSSAGSEYLETLARGLHHRFIARKIIPMPKEESSKSAGDSAKIDSNSETVEGARTNGNVGALDKP